MKCGIKNAIKECKKGVDTMKCSDCYFNDKPRGCMEQIEEALAKLEEVS